MGSENQFQIILKVMGDNSGGDKEKVSPLQQSPGKPGGLYSDRVKVTISRSERLKRNVLEINSENDPDASRIDKVLMAYLFKTQEDIF